MRVRQILVTLQGNLNKEPLRLITLQTWSIFLKTLRFKDIAPHVAPTTAAFVSAWPTFSPLERETAASVINYAVCDHSQELGEAHFLDDIVSLEGIAELKNSTLR